MTPYGIDPARIKANRPAAKVRRWWAQQITPWVGVFVFVVLPLILIIHIEGNVR